MSVDGYIAGPAGEVDWIVVDPDIDFGKMVKRFDTYLMGRRTFEFLVDQGQDSTPGMRTYVFSRTLRQSDHENVTIVGEDSKEVVQSLREQPGKDIWLFGGGALFRSLAGEGLVDAVEVAVIPTILGGGIPLVAHPASQIGLTLTECRVLEKTGTVILVYSVNDPRRRARTESV